MPCPVRSVNVVGLNRGPFPGAMTIWNERNARHQFRRLVLFRSLSAGIELEDGAAAVDAMPCTPKKRGAIELA